MSAAPIPYDDLLALDPSEVATAEGLAALIEQVERTFSAEGSRKALYDLSNLLRRLDEPTLRALVHWQGAADEDEMTEAAEEAP